MSLRVCRCVCSPVWTRVCSDEPEGRAFAGRSLSECVGLRVFASSPRMKLRSGPCVCSSVCVTASPPVLAPKSVGASVRCRVGVREAGLRAQGLGSRPGRPPAAPSAECLCAAAGRLWAPAGGRTSPLLTGIPDAHPAAGHCTPESPAPPSPSAFRVLPPVGAQWNSPRQRPERMGPLARRTERSLFHAGFSEVLEQLISLEPWLP